MNWENASVSNTWAIRFHAVNRDTTVENNIVYNMNPNGSSDGAPAMFIQYADYSGTAMVFQNNIIQDIANDLDMWSMYETSNKNGWTFTNNKYYASAETFIIGAPTYDFSGWVTQTGETGSFEQYTFPDSTRDIETYMSSLGQTATIVAFINKCRAQTRNNWDTDYTASIVNSWIRGGYFILSGSMSDYLENELLDHVFKTGVWTAPTNLFVALYTATPSDSGGGTEVTSTGSAYERVVNNTWDIASGGAIENTSVVAFTTATNDWGTIVAFGILDASGGGNLLWWGSAASSVTTGETVSFAAGAIDMAIN
jgi:hypothetical protein